MQKQRDCNIYKLHMPESGKQEVYYVPPTSHLTTNMLDMILLNLPSRNNRRNDAFRIRYIYLPKRHQFCSAQKIMFSVVMFFCTSSPHPTMTYPICQPNSHMGYRRKSTLFKFNKLLPLSLTDSRLLSYPY